MNGNLIENYARFIVKRGLNIQKNQILVLTVPVECVPFVRIIAKIAYEEGARDVVCEWTDDELSKIKLLYAPVEALEEFPGWLKDFYESYAKKDAAFLYISANDPDIMKDVNPDRISKASRARSFALKEYGQRKMLCMNSWCVASIPTKAWAKKVFPGIADDKAEEMLWQAIFKAVRIDNDITSSSWDIHSKDLKKYSDFLNRSEFKYLHYKNSEGTDLTIELLENHVWYSGSVQTQGGIEFVPNIPTEEIFTVPKKTGVNGTAASSKPLSYNGSLIDKFTITFKDGRIVDYDAESGYEILKDLIETDEGSHYLGEVALVPYNSPISTMNMLFYNSLFDENASCHLAIGMAYPCIKNIEKMSDEEIQKLDINNSQVHVDFMVGTKDLEIIGITKTGIEIPIFKNGNYAF